MASEAQNLIRLSEHLRSEGFDAWVDNDRNAVGVREPKTGLCILFGFKDGKPTVGDAELRDPAGAGAP